MATASARRASSNGTRRRGSKRKPLVLKNLIDGKFVGPVEGRREEVVNPATEEVIARAPLSTQADVDLAVKAARKAFESWGFTTPAERSERLLALADGIEARAGEIADLESADAGKPRSAFLEDEIPFMCDNLRYFAGAARNMEGRSAGEYLAGHTSFVRREPIGVVAQVTPWNYPLMMAVWKWAPAIAAGNCVVLKPSDTTPARCSWPS